MTNPKRHLITSALPYANGPLHIGHIAGAYLPADIYVRYLRQQGKDVKYVCGSDEHGAAITIRAKKDGVTPQEIVDRYHSLNKKTFEEFGINFDIYHRTSENLHHKTAQEFFKTLLNKGEFITETSEQYYDEENHQFLADRYITGTCPKCGHENAYGDQCEKCGSALSPTELINPKSTISGNTPILKETSHWYLPLNKHEDWLRDWLKNGQLDGQYHHNPAEWKKPVLGQCMSWIDGGLQKRAMTRDLDWGVKVPVEGADGKVLYVWLDAPIGYISATKQLADNQNFDWEEYWKSEDTEMIHFIGKDNIVFHCIIFPIILKAHGEFNLPVNVPANEFLNLEGQKISTSRNWAVWLHEYLEDFPTRKDELRYVLTSIAPEQKDSEFTWKDYQARVNNELVAILGNFVNRTVVLTHKYFDGIVPASGASNKKIESFIKDSYSKVENGITSFNFRQALADAISIARLGNKFLADTEPWKLIKSDKAKTGEILNISIQISCHLSNVIKPFLPDTSAKLESILNLTGVKSWEAFNIVSEGHQINNAELLFKKFEDEDVDSQMKKLEVMSAQKDAEVSYEAVKKNISFDDFQKLDIRIGEIKSAEKVKKADKLLQLKVDLGFETRNIVSGIAEHFTPEDLIGKKVTVLLNLEPRKIRGVLSEGMILMAETQDGLLRVLSPQGDVESGNSVS